MSDEAKLDVDRIEFLGWQEGLGKVRRLRWGGFVWDERPSGSTRATKRVMVTKIEGDWPSDEELLSLVDGDVPPRKSHFGGTVSRGANDTCQVSVYID